MKKFFIFFLPRRFCRCGTFVGGKVGARVGAGENVNIGLSVGTDVMVGV